MSGVRFCGFSTPSALDEIKVLNQYTKPMPMLLARGLSVSDAQALAWNATLLHVVAKFEPPLSTPQAVLERLSLSEIAGLCEAYEEQKEKDAGWDWNSQYEEEGA